MLAALKHQVLRRWMHQVAGSHAPASGRTEGVRRIALWQFGGVGDMLLATPVIMALRDACPEAGIDIWCSTPAFADFLQRFPNVTGIHSFPVYDFDTRTLLHGDTRRTLQGVGDDMAEQKPDMLINLHVPAMLDWWAVEWWLTRRLSPAFSLGFDPAFTEGRSVFDVSLNGEVCSGVHYTRSYRRLLEKGGMACGERTVFPLTDAERQNAVALLDESVPGTGRKVCMHIGARRLKLEGKMWPIERFAALAGQLLNAGLQPVLIGVASESEMAASLCERVPACTNLVGRTSLGEMAALIAQCDGFIGHDSGPFHVAAAVDTPCVAICGRADAELEYLDYQRDDVAVLTGDSPERITVDAVFGRAMGLFNHG